MSKPAPLANFQRKGRVNRILKKLEPQLVENTKRALIVKGTHTSQSIIDVLKDFSKLLKPNCKVLGRKNEITPFEDANSVEFLATKNDCSLFVVGSHSKKRTNNLILGRTFDGHVLDMIEFGVDAHTSLDSVLGSKKAVGSKPMILFMGDQWDSDAIYTRIQNLLLDFFRGDKVEMISLKGVDHVISCTAVEGKILIRTYSVGFQKSGTKVL
jgi:ribosome production factor 2